MKCFKQSSGFSLLEVLVALFIFGSVGMLLFQNLSGITFSIFNLERQYIAREIASNRLAYLQYVKRPFRNYNRQVSVVMGGRDWVLHEEIYYINTKLFNFKIKIKEKGQKKFIYETSNML